jgi:hypothetical protein
LEFHHSTKWSIFRDKLPQKVKQQSETQSSYWPSCAKSMDFMSSIWWLSRIITTFITSLAILWNRCWAQYFQTARNRILVGQMFILTTAVVTDQKSLETFHRK